MHHMSVLLTLSLSLRPFMNFLLSVKRPDSESSFSSDSVSRFDVKLFVGLISAGGSEYEQSVYLAFITELSVNPVSVNASICKLSVGLYSAVKFDSELSVCPVSISELTSKLSVLSVVTRENIKGLVFPAPVLETVYALSVWCVLVSPRLQSLLWVPDRTVPSCCSPDPLWCSPDLPWRSPALSALSWKYPALSAPHWWAPALSPSPWRSSALSAPHWWAPALSAPPWRSSALSALHWWASTLSAPPWRSPAPVYSAMVGSCSVCSAVEIGCLALVVFCSGLVVICSTVGVFCSTCSAVDIFCSALVGSSPVCSALSGIWFMGFI